MSHLLKKLVSLLLSTLMFWLYGVGELDAESWSEQMWNYGERQWRYDSNHGLPPSSAARSIMIGNADGLQQLMQALRTTGLKRMRTINPRFAALVPERKNKRQPYWNISAHQGALEKTEWNSGELTKVRAGGQDYAEAAETERDAPFGIPLSEAVSDFAINHDTSGVFGPDLGIIGSATGMSGFNLGSSLALNAMLTPSSPSTGIFTSFGPKNYVRETGSPVTVTDTFTVLNPATQYTLKAFNGGLQDSDTELVSSAVVTINGVQVLGPSNFNQNVAEVDVPVTLHLANTISVQVRGKPGGTLAIQIVGVDSDPPTISAAASPVPDSFGWNNSDVVVTFTCADKTSGVASCPLAVTISTEGANQVVSGTAVDRAGNAASTSVSISLDKTAPSILATSNPAPDTYGWNNTAVTVNFSCSDSLSGIASCTPGTTVSTEGANQVVTGNAADRAGNAGSANASVSIDKTAPTITATQSPSPNGAGWNNSAVTVNFTCADSLSGIATCPAAAKVSGEGASQTISGTASDRAGNSSSASVSVNLDETPPDLTITSPANSANVSSAALTVSGTVTDALSGVASVSCNGALGAVQNGAFSCPVNLSVGANSIGVTAVDVAGNSSSESLNVTYQPVASGQPFISSISPPGGHFGDIITINGGGFGTDRTQVKVRFSYDYGSGVYNVDQPVIGVADANLTVAVPLAVPTKTNQVSVFVGNQTSTPVPYDVGALPADPTPNVAGNEAFALVADMDQLLSRTDARIDDWYVSTGTLTTTDTAQFHQVMTALRQALQTLQANAQNQVDQQTLHGLDILVSTQLMGLEHQKLLAAAATLSGSPVGSRLCESLDLVNALNDIVDALDIVSEVLDVLLTAIVAACAVSVILSIITLGTFSELSGLICGVGASAIVEFLRDFNAILKSAVQVARAIVNPAPNQPILGTYKVLISQFKEWAIEKPQFVYVNGTDPVSVSAFNDFDNPQCKPDGCPIDLTFPIPIIDQSITVTIHVPYKIATALGVDANLQFLPGLNNQIGFMGSGPDFNGVSTFTGADVNGPGLQRGIYSVTTSSQCGGQLLGTQTDPYRLISGPVFTSVDPSSAQLGDTFTVCGDPTTIPPSGAAASAVDFGDAQARIATISNPGCFPATVPDTGLLSGPLKLIVNGRTADQTQPFTVLPPTLNPASPDEVFATEPVVITGTGFAAADSNNSLTGNDVPVNVMKRKGNTITFTMGNATGGPLQLTAVGDHVSNQVPFKPVLSWSQAVKLSNPNRDAMNPVVVALPDGRIGAAWIDRRLGGTDSLLFTDAKPGDSTFRSPITITSDLGGFVSSPQRPGLAGGANDRFYVTWIDSANQVHISSFQFGTVPGGDVIVATAPTGFALKETAVGVAPNGVVNVTVTEAPLNGDFNYVLAEAISQDGGATFTALNSVDGPAPYLGEPTLTQNNGVLWRAYTKGVLSKLQAQIRMFVQSSADGHSWNALGSASALAGIDQHPSVTGDGSGPIVAWDSTTYEETKIVGISTGSLAGSAALTPFFPNVSGSDGKHPSVAVDSTGIISVAWNNRRVGQSPDGEPGIPALIFNRFRTHDFNQPAGPNQNPSHILDSTTLESMPWMSVVGNRRLHLVWLSGPAGNRIVEYTNDAGYLFTDTNAPDPLPTPLTPRNLIAVSTEMGSIYQGTLLIDPDRPTDTRWAGAGLLAAQDPYPSNMGPSISPDSSTLLIESGSNEIGTQLSNFGDDSTPFLSPNGLTGVAGGEFAAWSPDGSVFALVGKQIPPVNVTLPKLYHSTAAQPNLLAVFNPLLLTSRTSETDQAVSPDALLLAYEQEQEATALSPINHTLRIVRLSTGQDAADIQDAYYPAWGSANDKVVFVQKKFDANQNLTEFDLMEVSFDGSSTPGLPQAFTPDKELQWPVYSPDGSNVAYQIKNGPNWTISLASGTMFPVTAGVSDTRPVWSPDSKSLAFIRTDSTGTSQVMRWDLSAPAAIALTSLPAGVVLGGAQVNCSSPFAQTNFFGQKPTVPCTRGRLVWAEVHE